METKSADGGGRNPAAPALFLCTYGFQPQLRGLSGQSAD
jgi:hypothetical protein